MSATAAPATRPTRHQDRFHRGAARWILLAAVGLLAVVMVLPFVLMVMNAFKSPSDYSSGSPLALPTEIYTDGLVYFWHRVDFPVKLWNSIWTSALVAVLGTFLSLFNAYAIGVGRVKGRAWIIALFMIANMLPQEGLIYPLFMMARKVGLTDSPWSIVVIFTVIQSAFGTYLLSSVLGTFPRALLEAAELDGASRWQILWRVVYPIVRPTMSVLMIFFFIWTWNEFFIPLVMLTSGDTQTVPIALSSLQGDRMLDVPTLNAGALVSLVPTFLFFLVFQRTLTRGVTAGAVK
ncbi:MULTISPECIES: carbohydrate ABC transporter permease [unclassified Actinomyces]|uniref:carbohydrate ABC transporter permease n=2 Tax=Actinomyces TaxID=1654 RepID=UPI0020183A23|nr:MULTISPECIES: carbohydrate ABC transporter permease [unclassified Actinomyces]MCL3777363.1 carbohydrate ABC transporter permease [Actinomyces sp. AC-20-1]MCL3789332.1 carbohydrate ABC transporter permease [Actinomyces sp. 187325]MCL3792528.1 carbohydrate ABC transporter permease [Actinomyces sp. 186855]MCL3793999.1 carbohydrate ABC transporter permease [Actinomyces sp. 217892]